jgi:ubiquinone/menaquinone biosynthesis C-methylase UbiE
MSRQRIVDVSVSKRFSPGQVDYEGSMARDFNAARAVSPDAQNVWRAALDPYLGGTTRVLDVGSGTGRFSVLLAQWFGVVVIGVEPAAGMRRIAPVDERRPQASYVGGRAEELPLKADTFDAALVSNVYHHIQDRLACADELCRVSAATDGFSSEAPSREDWERSRSSIIFPKPN